MFSYWGARLCKLRNSRLVYYKPTNVNVVSGVLDFNLLTCAVEVDRETAHNSFRIVVLRSSREFVFRAASNSDLMEWVYQIQRQIQTSKGYRHELTSVSIQPHYWRYMRVSPDVLRRTADTGDLVLFRSKGVLPWLMRTVTCSGTGKISSDVCA